MKSSRVVFDFGTWDITVRELIAAPTIIGVLIVLGFVIAGKIDNKSKSRTLFIIRHLTLKLLRILKTDWQLISVQSLRLVIC